MATIRSSGASQSTIKLVATNLIASGKLAGELKVSVYCYEVLFIYARGRRGGGGEGNYP